MEKIKRSWLKDPKAIHLMHKAQKASGPGSKYTWQAGLLKRKGKLIVGDDPVLRTDLLRYFHSSPEGVHSGVDATSRCLAIVVFWKGMKKAVRTFVRGCSVC